MSKRSNVYNLAQVDAFVVGQTFMLSDEDLATWFIRQGRRHILHGGDWLRRITATPELCRAHPWMVEGAAYDEFVNTPTLMRQLNHVRDYIVSIHVVSHASEETLGKEAQRRLQKIKRQDFATVLSISDRWFRMMNRKKFDDNEGVVECLDLGDIHWVELVTPNALDAEGSRMAHCVGGGSYDLGLGVNHRVFSLRRKEDDRSRLTFYLKGDLIGEWAAWNNLPMPVTLRPALVALLNHLEVDTVIDDILPDVLMAGFVGVDGVWSEIETSGVLVETRGEHLYYHLHFDELIAGPAEFIVVFKDGGVAMAFYMHDIAPGHFSSYDAKSDQEMCEILNGVVSAYQKAMGFPFSAIEDLIGETRRPFVIADGMIKPIVEVAPPERIGGFDFYSNGYDIWTVLGGRAHIVYDGKVRLITVDEPSDLLFEAIVAYLSLHRMKPPSAHAMTTFEHMGVYYDGQREWFYRSPQSRDDDVGH